MEMPHPDIYAQLLQLSSHMLSLAQSEQWDELAAQEKARRELVDLLKCQPAHNGVQQPETDVMIRQILKIDAATTALIEHRMADLGESITSLGVTHQLERTYR